MGAKLGVLGIEWSFSTTRTGHQPNHKPAHAMKSRLQFAGLSAALATTAALQAEVTINENISLDGYFIGAGVVTEGSAAKNGPNFGKSGSAFDAAYVAVNGTYKSLSSKVSLFSFNPFDGTQLDGAGDPVDNVGVLDAYVTYKISESLSVTGGKYLGYLGFESFHSPNNAFISFSQAIYSSPWATGAKIDYAGEGFSTGFSVRDSQNGSPGEGFFEGDGEFGDDVGYEVYFMLTSVENLTVFAGLGYEDSDVAPGDDATILTADLWANYAVNDKLSFAGEISILENHTDFSWLLQGTYAVTDKLAVSARVTGKDGTGDPVSADPADGFFTDASAYGLASTYTISDNFSIKGEVTKTDKTGGAGDEVGYALQGLFRF